MSDLSVIEVRKLEKFLGMENGYVLDFTNSTFQAFILDNVSIDIEDKKYLAGKSSSKANRLRTFWKLEPNFIVGKLISALLEYCKVEIPISESNQTLFDECFKISQRLIQEGEQGNKEVDELVINVHFEDIQRQIVEQLEIAKFTIWVAVAWFTDRVLFEKLLTKENQGINVQLIIIDDETNKNSGLDYDKFETYRLKKRGKYENIMHHKFCIIDLKTVIRGTYNWTNKAQFNNEDITIVNSRKDAEEFAERFIKLKNYRLLPE